MTENIINSNAKTDVIVITTGGTIEKTYDEFDGSLSNKGPVIKNIILSKLRLPYTEIHVHPVFSKDSLHMTDEDRSLLAESIKELSKKKVPIVVLHGTDTMAKSAEYCLEDLGEVQVPVVFTGAMKPLGFEDSDARQNVTEALLACKLLKSGLYISFHNKVFEVPRVRKNRSAGTFETY